MLSTSPPVLSAPVLTAVISLGFIRAAATTSWGCSKIAFHSPEVGACKRWKGPQALFSVGPRKPPLCGPHSFAHLGFGRYLCDASGPPRIGVRVRTLSMQASGTESSARGQKAAKGQSDGKDWRRGRGGAGGGGRGGRGGGGGLRSPPVLSEADLASLEGLAGVQALTSKGHKVLVLAVGKARLFYEGNPVVFGGAVGAVLGKPLAGDVVSVTDHNGKLVGWGVYNPDSMYRVRMLWLESIDGPAADTRDVSATLCKRLAAAVAVRKSLLLPHADTNAYRLVNGEGDRMSGIVIDMYKKLLVFSSSARWVERYKPEILAAIHTLFDPAEYEVVWRLSQDRLRQDGWTPLLPEPLATPATPATEERGGEKEAKLEESVMVIEELGVKFAISPRSGQKTGHYCDQRDNRKDFAKLCKGLTVLDSFCYSGGFGISAALQGATSVDCVDSSAPALLLAEKNAALNGVSDKLTLIKQDVADFLEESVRARRQWDCIVLDPPKLAPRRDDLENAKRKYKSLNKAALQCVRAGGLLLSCTCSSAMAQTDELLPVIRQAAAEAGRQVTVVRTVGAAGDHPVNPAFPEGRYLAGYLLAVQ